MTHQSFVARIVASTQSYKNTEFFSPPAGSLAPPTDTDVTRGILTPHGYAHHTPDTHSTHPILTVSHHTKDTYATKRILTPHKQYPRHMR